MSQRSMDAFHNLKSDFRIVRTSGFRMALMTTLLTPRLRLEPLEDRTAPAVLTVTDGAWFAPSNGLEDFVEPPLASAEEVGDYRVLYLGDPRLIPFPSQELGGGVAMAIVGDGPADLRDRWPVPDQTVDAQVREAIE